MTSKTRILIPTCDRYAAVAGLTAGEIDRQWPAHPPAVLCGESGGGDSRLQEDWGGIVLDAVRGLSSRGCEAVYLILDDHAPVGPCNGAFLNDVLPDWLAGSGAAVVSLNGAGQGRPEAGVPEAGLPRWVERVSEDFDWRYTLHPALWRVGALLDLLHGFEQQFPASKRSAWRFERELARAGGKETARWDRHCYRVVGGICHAPGFDWPRGGVVRARRRMADGVAALLDVLRLRAWREGWEERTRYLHRAYVGPYPLYWSGLLQKGVEHADAVRFLNLAGCGPLVARLKGAMHSWLRGEQGGEQ